MKLKKNNAIPVFMLLLSVAGFSLFFLIPFLMSLGHAFIENPFTLRFVGLRNFTVSFQNKYFMLGLKNTAIFMAVGIPLNIMLSLAAALIINRLKFFSNIFSLVFLIPLAIPSATTAFFWSNLFAKNGLVNQWFGFGVDWFNSDYGLYVMILIFLWKNIGFNLVLFISGLGDIPLEYYEVARVYGASRFQMLCRITLVYLTPTFFLTLIMSFVNSFRIFKEIYIITGDTPHESVYVLQHYVNNTFFSLNYQRMTSAVYILTVFIVLFVALVLKAEIRLSRDLRRLT
ncbi:MAG: sugar ABC transporter permease [Oscillospiraceae bacterium]|nr:sugar ABC transporter permease [Oscillospiraceae bacterium]